MMSGSKIAVHVEKASRELREQETRSKGSYMDLTATVEDPDTEDGSDQTEAKLEIWKLLPQLQNVPESTLKKLPLSAIFQLSNALTKNSKVADKMSVSSRLAANVQAIMKNPGQVKGGQDNRKTILHEGRFLGGAGCSMADIWTRGKEVVGATGPLPIGSYDLDTVGCGGCVTAKGWQEVHNPSSQELRIKQFYLPNVAGSNLSTRKITVGENGEDFNVGENLKEISDLDGYKGALNVLREAMASALPWNRSISAICGYMCNTNFLQTDLASNPKRAAILAEFTDYILGRNALNWDNGQQFISTDEMAHIWSNWKGKRTALFFTKEKQDNRKGGQGRTGQSGQREKSDICRKFNAKICTKQSDKECVTFFGNKLRHVCNKYMPAGGICGKDHPRADHV